MSRFSIRACSLIGLGLLFFTFGSQRALAQNDGYLTNSNTRGLAAENSFQIGDIDNINLASGALNLNIPVFQRKGRGGKLDKQFFFSYNSKIWSMYGVPDSLDPQDDDYVGWTQSAEEGYYNYLPLEGTGGPPGTGRQNFGRGSGRLNYNEQVWDCVGNGNIQYEETADYQFEYQMPDGSAYRLPNLHRYESPTGHWCTSLSALDIGYAEMGGIELDTTNSNAYTAELKDGTRNVNGPIYDTNGNFMDTYDADTLGRSVSYTYQNGITTWSFTDSNGATQQVTEQFSGGATSTTQFPSPGCGNVPAHQDTDMMGGTTTITMPDGRAYTLTFDPNFAEVTKVTLPTGGYIRYVYVTLAAFDAKVQFALNASCAMDSRRVSERFVSPDGNPQHEQEWQYSYSNANSVYTTTVTDPLGNVTVHTFDGLRRLHETMTQYYDNAGHLLRTVANTWSNDYRTVAEYPKTVSSRIETGETPDYVDWQITQSTTTLADTNQVNEVQTNYDTSGCGTSCSIGNVQSKLEYDWGTGAPGPLLRRTVYTYLSDSNSNYLNKHILDRVASKTIYDSTNNTCQGQSRVCAETTYGYDTTAIASQPSVVQHDYTDYPKTMTYRGNLTTVSNWRNTDNSWLTTTNSYDELGNLIQTNDPRGNNSYFSYADAWSGTACVPVGGTANAFLTKTTNALGQITTAQYFPCSSLVASATDVNNQPTTQVYDGVGRLTQQNFPDGGQTTNCYSDNSGSSCYSSAVPPFIVTTTKQTASQNLTFTTLVDGLGRPTENQVNSAPQTIYTDTSYDALGRVSAVSNPYYSVSDPTYGITSHSYDPLGRTIQVIDQDGSIVSTVYSGNCATATDEQGKKRESCADGLGRMTSVIEDPTGLGYTTNYTFDALDNLISVTQSGSAQRSFTYDSVSELTQAVNPESGTINYSYDADGNLVSKVAPAPNSVSGTVTTCFGSWSGSSCNGSPGYDALNRLLEKMYSNGDPTVTYSYDQTACLGQSSCHNTGHRTSMTDAGGSEEWSYDSMGRTLADQRTTNSVTKSTVYTYSPYFDGSIYKITYPSTLAVIYTYDGGERPTSATDSNGNTYALAATYAAPGALQAATVDTTSAFAGFSISNSYTPRLQPNELKVSNGSNSVMDFVYCFSALADNPSACPSGTGDNGNVARIVNNMDGTRSQMFSYDSLNRISVGGSFNTSGTNCWGEQYGYDAWANLKTISFPSSIYNSSCTLWNSLNVGISAKNQINSPSGYGFDGAGNMTAAPGPVTYTYNAEGEMTAAASVNYSYGGDGKRVEKSNGTLYWYGMSGDALEETGLTGTLVNDYIFFGGQRIARRDASGNIFAYFEDHLGSSRKVQEIASGGSTASVSYDADFTPFGREIFYVNTSDPIHKFTGKERDSESGLDNFGARYFASTTGRFMIPDWSARPTPIPFADLANPQSLNLYSYVANNPTSRADPLGHNWFFIGGDWQWHKGKKYTYTDSNGNSQTVTSNFTALLIAQATGTDQKTGATTYNLTLYDQNKRVFQGTAFSGGGGNPSIKDGNYTMRLDIRDPNGPTTLNPQSPLNNPPEFYGIQRIHDFNLPDGIRVDIEGAYGHTRVHLNPWDGADRGDFLHEQHNGLGYTHGCLCYGTQTRLSDILWGMPPQKLPVAVDVPVTQP